MKRIRITVEGKTYEVDVEVVGEQATVTNIAAAPVRASAAVAAPAAAPAPKPAAAPAAGAGDIVSPLAAVVVSVDVQVGQAIKEGDKVLVIEAMKMNTVVNSTATGTVKAILVKPGESIQEGQPLISVG
ncbi:MAG: acetyl-CoA carboxylase biotin carboxyl carrier protein subunit [Puniceicoccales bacterium]|jgi:biotin carboxyl carrier protein|nr:acetyl-CoA carboxylase biotin carboxyl carrier protein subunit [Puniceicoccales bacterium]